MVSFSILISKSRQIVIIAIIIFISLVRCIFLIINDDLAQQVLLWFSFATNPIILEFISGYLISYHYKKVLHLVSKVRSVFLHVGVFFVFFLVLFEIKTVFISDDLHVGVMFLPALFIFIYSIKIFEVDGKKVPQALALTSRISYSIYLLHMAIIFTVIEISKVIYGGEIFKIFATRFNLLFISLLFSWVISYYFCVFFEENIARRVKNYIIRL